MSDDELVARLRAIAARRPPGTRLPAERELAHRLGAGRARVRNALRRLDAQGVIEVRAQSGTYVSGAPGRTCC